MNIAVIAPTHIPARRANTVQVMKMAQALVSLGHDVRLATPGPKPGLGRDSEPESTWEYLARHYGLCHRFPVDWLSRDPRLRGYDFSLRAVRWARSWKAELIYTRLPQAAAVSSQLGLRTIFEVHDLPQGNMSQFLLRAFIRGKGARRLVVITQALAADLKLKLSAPIMASLAIVASDGVDLERYANLPSPEQARDQLVLEGRILNEKDNSSERFTAGYSGHLYIGRGTAFLLELAARLPEVTFLIVGGEPSDVFDLQKRAQNRGLENVILTGFVPNADLPRYQAACDVLLMPYQQRVAASSGGDISRYLSPMKLFEYMASNRAIISSDLPVLQEVLNEENAILLPGDDIEAWTKAIKELQASPETRQRLAHKARQDVNLYTWENRAARILEGI
jgi:glycosyltransferase involved in cell wall biosynthesis